ncbi:aldo/keto reductase [Subtercola boreus]|uniref:2,5-diketo-D-gluconic acid reductase n=1 Tax=Subtercola boreus TaxID=120213 RepID=A0A3E0W9G5_9MICO|nr:aldo/keto reductase [Subtercola boreus]RFA19350.1 2,5-diketo-D-gluconic acid reductase [Subtercola boreus]RFA19611.1 2,5-diketo-D-gluconic acid reductase [Subtercola boreus]RFA25977.1 2,5-diketo-D-gluconic acid reductase [Subtercola boreus]
MTAETTDVETIEIAQGVHIPQIGLGVFQVPADEAQRVVEDGLSAGYRHVDTAAAYVNEAGVGAALRASGLNRDDVFLTSKLRNGDQGYEQTRRAYADSVERLGIESLDLYLIHWPYPSAGLFEESWRALQDLAAEGAVRAVGVSNFLPEHLEAITKHGGIRPAVNQIELHPTFQQPAVASASRALGVAVQAYSPLGQGADFSAKPVLEAATAHGASPAQVILAWHLALGHIVIPKSSRPDRLAENLASAGLRLTQAEIDAITALDSNERIGGDPATFSLTQMR